MKKPKSPVKTICRVYCVVLLCLFILASIGGLISLVGVYGNTENLERDFSVERVKDIKSDGSIILQDGSSVNYKDIDSFVKIEPDKGMWYHKEENCLFLEVSRGEAFLMVIVPVIIGLMYVVFVTIFQKKNIFNPKRAILVTGSVLMVGFLLGFYTIFGLDMVLYVIDAL